MTDARSSAVLIIEDEDVVAGAMTRWLLGLGYNIARAASAEEAAERMSDVNPSVVICDVGLPGKDGLWFANTVRRTHPETAVVLATGRNNLPPSETMRGGVVSYLVKPFGRDELRRAVSDAVTWHRDAAPAPAKPEPSEVNLAAMLRARLGAKDFATDTDASIEALFPDKSERQRIDRVQAIAVTLAAAIGLSSREQDDVAFAARVQRLWHLAVPAEIGDGATGYSHRELAILRRAPAHLAVALAEVGVPSGARALIHALRERVDGLGTPDRLMGDRIPAGSRVLAVAEAIEAMCHDRSDRPALPRHSIARELQRCTGVQFDRDVVRAAMKHVLA